MLYVITTISIVYTSNLSPYSHSMDLICFWVGFLLFSSFWVVSFCDPEGFLSLSCGGSSSYVDSYNISWVSDNAFINTGKSAVIDYTDGTTNSVRFFPTSQDRKCYRLPIKNVSSMILVRSKFLYKNYDGKKNPPTFFVSIGTAVTSYVDLWVHDPWIEEFVWPVDNDVVSFCLYGIPDGGFPVISSLEVRPLPRGAYENGIEDLSNKSLKKCYRINSGYTEGSLRYPLDPLDRLWDADENYTPIHLSTEYNNIPGSFKFSNISEMPPLSVLQNARVLVRRKVLSYNLPLDTLGDYYIILYFTGILPVSPSFDLIINGYTKQSNYTVKIFETDALYFTQKGIKNLNITFKSIKFNPQVNAIEVYRIVDIPPVTSSTTVSALEVIEQSTGLDLGWQDDPCSPFPWDHIGCEGNLVTSLDLSDISLRSISPTFGDLLDLKTLNLSFNHLTSFGSDFENLISLQVLDLQNNSLQGIVPDSLGDLHNLHLLNLENNKLQGTLPQSLNRESLEVRSTGNLCLSFSTLTCNDVSSNPSIETPRVAIFPKKKHTHIHKNHLSVLLGAIGGAFLALLLVSLLVILHARKRRSKDKYTTRTSTEIQNWNTARIFTYKEIKTATNNFKEIIGHGSFGSVYLGKLPDGKLVAVKVRFDRTQLGADSFINEVHLLSQIRHQNLVCFEGFCHESKKQILVYEYLPGGSLTDHLYGSKTTKVSLSWIRRLKIAVDAAKGLDYLHNGSEPRIIHRDVKCSNILLDKEMNAKVCDFGLSKQVMQPYATHVTTVVRGTAGYLDPEYYSTQQLTEKSDVYSFGVVLLELICGRETLNHSGAPGSFNLVLWAKPYLQAGTLEIVDDSLNGTFDVKSMRKAALVAVKSVEREASLRPTIANVLAELKEAYSIQFTYLLTLGEAD